MLILRKEIKLGLSTLPRAVTLYKQRCFSKDKKPETTEQPLNANNKKQQATVVNDESAAARLNKLLMSMQKDDTAVMAKNVTLPKPGAKIRKRREELKEEKADKDIFVAAKRVAELIDDGASTKQSEMELLSKLLNHNKSAAEPDAAPGSMNAEQTSLIDLMKGMKIERKKTAPEISRSEHVRHKLQGERTGAAVKERKHQGWTDGGSVNLFGAQPLGIFKAADQLREMPDILNTWTQLEKQSLQMQVMHPPANYFEKIARWTESDRVWHYPIDNEQGLIEEQEVDFTEHIFLEQHLESWCPQKGPIRHFMELVCVGLSKNPYISAKEKRAHILWYRDYFESKKDMLKELMKNTTKSTDAQAQLSST